MALVIFFSFDLPDTICEKCLRRRLWYCFRLLSWDIMLTKIGLFLQAVALPKHISMAPRRCDGRVLKVNVALVICPDL
jgi:hypothetical protein